MTKIPVTVLTGYLGAGKTTLLNRILSEPHGHKYAVVVNEFGETGIDGDLIVGADEEIFEMNNGCLCCTVRGDLIRVINGLLKRAGKFDGILIETTGLADPGPVVQTFFADEEIAAKAALDSVITVVDSKHIALRLKDSREAQEQIAFADVIILNKADLVNAEEMASLKHRIHTLNRYAKIVTCERGQIPLSEILGLNRFDLNHILAHEPDFLDVQKPDHGHKHDHHHHDHGHIHHHHAEGEPCNASCHPHHDHNHAQGHEGCCDHDHGHDHHHHDDCNAACDHPDHHHDHTHDSSISSFSLQLSTPIDLAKFEAWMGTLRTEKGEDLLRYKGILDVAGRQARLAIQGVHMMMDGSELTPWPADAVRQSRLVFIGRNLDKAVLEAGFAATAADRAA